MFYVKFGISVLLSYVLAMSAGQLFGQESDSIAIFTPIFAADFEDVLIESPSGNLVAGLSRSIPGGPSLTDIAMASTTAKAKDPTTGIVNSGEFNFCCLGCQTSRLQSAGSMKGHCQLMAKLLSAAIQEGEQSSDAQRKVIEAALMMIAETSEAKAQAKIAWLEANHQKQLANLRRQLENSNPASSSFSQLREWLSPIYKNQNRNFHQMKKIAANGDSLSQTVGMLERKIDAQLEPATPQTIQNSLYGDSLSAESENRSQAGYRRLDHKTDQADPSASKGVDNTEYASRLRREIHTLQLRLQGLQQKAVRPANHLEPVFTPDRPLRPLYQR